MRVNKGFGSVMAHPRISLQKRKTRKSRSRQRSIRKNIIAKKNTYYIGALNKVTGSFQLFRSKAHAIAGVEAVEIRPYPMDTFEKRQPVHLYEDNLPPDEDKI